MSFALYGRPGGVVFLDDDPQYLEMLAEVMPPDWSVRVFLSPASCIDMLLAEPAVWETDAWTQQEIVKRWREGVPLIPQILSYWRDDGNRRFGLTQVCVVDYSMPAMSGLRVLSELTPWSGARVLLTGRADEQLAVSAFNRGLINQFIPKQAPDLRLRLSAAIRELRRAPNARHEQTWRGTLTREQYGLMCDPAIAQALENLTLERGWVEHVVIGAPFGVLGLDRHAGVSWLQLEPTRNLQELAEMAESQGWDTDCAQQIRAGKKLIDLELQLALGSGQKPQPQDALVLGKGDAVLYAALFAVQATCGPQPENSYEHFIARRQNRLLGN